MNALQRLKTSLEKHGTFGTVWLAFAKLGVAAGMLEDRWFDIRNGTDTVRIVELDQLDIASENKPFGMRYEVTRARLFKKLMKTLDPPLDGGFVDFGSGKGRVLMLAAQHGFDVVVGVEFSHELCEAARKNLATFQAKIGRDLDVEIVEADVVDYEVRPNQNVFFMFNPFDAGIMEVALDKISASVDSHPRRVWLIYQYPECRTAIDGYGRFAETASYVWGGREFVVYENRSN
jgi:SAM-dependent methyltransferase